MENEITLEEIRRKFEEALPVWTATDFYKEKERAAQELSKARELLKKCSDTQKEQFKEFRKAAGPGNMFANHGPEYEAWLNSVHDSAEADKVEKHKRLCQKISNYWEARQRLFHFLNDLIHDEKLMKKAETTPARYKRYENAVKPFLEKYQLKLYYDSFRAHVTIYDNLGNEFSGEYNNENMNTNNINNLFNYYLSYTPPALSVDVIATKCEKAHDQADKIIREASEKAGTLRKIYKSFFDQRQETIYY